MSKSCLLAVLSMALVSPFAAVQAQQGVQTLPGFTPHPDTPAHPEVIHRTPQTPAQPIQGVQTLPEFIPHAPPPSQQLYAGNIRCESNNFRPQRCSARTQNRVTLVHQQGNTPCIRNQSWRYDANSITVYNGCRGTFAYGFGNVAPGKDRNGNALPWILAGAGAAAGIYAIVNSGNNNSPPPEPRPAPPMPEQQPVVAPPAAAPPPVTPPVAPPVTPPVAGPPFPPLPPAKIEANLQMLTAAQQPSMQSCLFEGARQVGASGGSLLRLDAVDRIEQGNGGWRFTFRATGRFPDRDRRFSVFCRATPTSIIEFTPTAML